LTFLNRILPNKIILGLSGLIPFKISNKISFWLEMNESSPMSSVYWHNPATFEFTPLFIELVQECNVFLDVGANLGFYSFLAEKCQPNITIHAFEPSNGAFYFLDKNKQHNKGKNTFVHKIALSDFEGNITFFEEINPKYPYLKYHLSGMSNTGSTQGMRASQKYDVPTETMDGFVSRMKLPAVDLIKMDTEGTEHLILGKGYETIRKFEPIFIIEVLEEKAARALEKHIFANNYLIFQYSDHGLIPLKEISMGSTEKDRNFFFVPPSKLAKIEKFIAK
jgi:FkbM family methyltransferase